MPDEKLPKSSPSVSFEHPAKGKHHCFRCLHFQQKQQRCSKIMGIVRSMDWCRLWEHRTPTYQRTRALLSEKP